MMISTSNFLNSEADQRTGQNINSVKIDFSRMAFLPPTNAPFTPCKFCGGLLTEQDSRTVFQRDAQNDYLWNCRFCKRQNRSKQLYFAENNYKFAIQKQLKSKITPPIVLFVIDNSGSMYQSIFYNLKYGNNPQVLSEAKKGIQQSFTQILSQSKLYRQEREMLAKLQANYFNIVRSSKYAEEEISKIAFLYAMIQHNLRQLAKREHKAESRVGFIFFSDMLYVLKGAKQKEIPVYVQSGQLCHEEWPYRKHPVDFFEFQDMYRAGREYEKYFGDSRLQNFDVGKVAVGKAKGGGRTALGPALALAMGIISMHDQGSRIIVATDSLPNFGLLSVGDADAVYKQIGNCLQENGATLSILKWVGDELIKSKEQQSFATFRNCYRDHVQQIELNLAKCKQNKSLQISIMTLNHLISREPVGHSCEVQIYCDNPRVIPAKLPMDINDYKAIRFLSNQSRCWLSLGVDRAALQQYDYLFPVITQTVVKYADLFTRQRYLFMSYTKHQLIRPKLMKQPEGEGDVTLHQETINLGNINELCNLELMHLFETFRRTEDRNQNDRDDIKTVFKYKQIEMERDIRDINDIALMKGQLYQETPADENYEQL